jgi:hypothetical protein
MDILQCRFLSSHLLLLSPPIRILMYASPLQRLSSWVHRLSTGLPIPCCPIFGSALFSPATRSLGLLFFCCLSTGLLDVYCLSKGLLGFFYLFIGVIRFCCLSTSIKPKKTKKKTFSLAIPVPNWVLKKNIWRTKKEKIRKKKLYRSLL